MGDFVHQIPEANTAGSRKCHRLEALWFGKVRAHFSYTIMRAIWNDSCYAARRRRGSALWLAVVCCGAALVLTASRGVWRNLDLSPDSPVFAFMFAGSLAAGVAMALAPALSSAGYQSLRGETLPGPLRRFPARKALMAVQTAAWVTLLVAAGLYIRIVQRASSADVDLVNTSFQEPHKTPRTVLKLAKQE